MSHDKEVQAMYNARHYSRLTSQLDNIKTIIINHKSAYTVWEWIKLKEVLNIKE